MKKTGRTCGDRSGILGPLRTPLFSSFSLILALGIGPALMSARAAGGSSPDWTGYYSLANGRELAGTGFKQDAPGEALNALITPHLQPWAKARMEAAFSLCTSAMTLRTDELLACNHASPASMSSEPNPCPCLRGSTNTEMVAVSPVMS